MGLKEQLNEDMKQAMKAKDKNRLSAIRMVRGAVRDKEINSKVELDDDGGFDSSLPNFRWKKPKPPSQVRLRS